MMTWANWGGSSSNFQSYTPWHGSDGEAEFKEFAQSNSAAMASAKNVDFSRTYSVNQGNQTVRVVTPADGTRLTSSQTVIRVKTENIDPSLINLKSVAVIVSKDGINDIRLPLTYTCNGYFQATLNLDDYEISLDQSRLNITPELTYINSKAIPGIADASGNTAGTIHVIAGAKPTDPVDVVDTFDSYDSVADLRSVYSPNHTSRNNIDLVDAPQGGENKALSLHYDFNASPDYNGYARSFSPRRNWSGYSAMSMFLQSDGSDQKFVVQINAGGVTFEAYPSLKAKESKTLNLAFDDFAPASWDTANAGRKLTPELLSSVGSFALYVNDNGETLPRSGTLLIDSVKLTGEREPYTPEESTEENEEVKPLLLDDFSSYSDTDALRSAWGNRQHTEVLNLVEREKEGEKALEFAYDFSKDGWYDVARYIGDNKELNNWRGQGTLHAKVRGGNSGNAIGLQIGTSAGVYFHTDIKLDFEGWKTIDIPLLNNPALVQSWPDDANKGKTMTSDDLKTIKEIVVASSQQNSENSSIAFALGELSLIPSEKAEESSPAPTVETPAEETAPVSTEGEDATRQDAQTCPIVEKNDENTSSPSDNEKPNTNEQKNDVKKPAQPGKQVAGRKADSSVKALAHTGVNVMTLVIAACALAIASLSIYAMRKKTK